MEKSSRGFTLIEMLIVIAVISILAGIVLVGITGFQASARDTKRIGDLRSVQNNIELFYVRCGFYPTTNHGSGCASAPTGSGEGSFSWSDLESALSNNGVIGVGRLANDPQSGRTYQYGYGVGGYAYVLKAQLEAESSALNDPGQPDGTIYTVDCTNSGRNYCIVSE